MKVIRKRLDTEQIYVLFTRYSEDCECVEITFDGGETWTPSPESDPRTGGAFRAPPLEIEDAKCLAAIRMVAVIHDQIDAALTAATAVGLATSILAIVTAIVPGMNILVSIFVAVAGAVLAFGSAALSADFTEENYTALECIFYHRISENGQVTGSQLENILLDIETEFGTSVIYPVCELLFQTLGINGFSNAGVLRTEDGECVDCGWCYEFNFLVDNGGFTDYGTGGYSEGGGWYTGLAYAGGDPARGRRQVQITKDFGFTVTADRIEMEYSAEVGINTAPTGTGMWYDTFGTLIATATVEDGAHVIVKTGSISIGNIQLSLGVGGCEGCGDPGGVGAIQKLRFYGSGLNPFGDDNC